MAEGVQSDEESLSDLPNLTRSQIDCSLGKRLSIRKQLRIDRQVSNDEEERKSLLISYNDATSDIVNYIVSQYNTMQKEGILDVLYGITQDEKIWTKAMERLKTSPDVTAFDENELMDSILKWKVKNNVMRWHSHLDPKAVGTAAHFDMMRFLKDYESGCFMGAQKHLRRICELTGYGKTHNFIKFHPVLGKLSQLSPFKFDVEKEYDIPLELEASENYTGEDSRKFKFKPDLIVGYDEHLFVYDWKFWSIKSYNEKTSIYVSERIEKMKMDMHYLQHYFPAKLLHGYVVIFPTDDLEKYVMIYPAQEDTMEYASNENAFRIANLGS